ncbi:MAG: hypothetical protein M3N12_03080 [Verrucomicrobiota bacterium]|nr:hypothetical protein [Verrucomicrobiota bacterium]
MIVALLVAALSLAGLSLPAQNLKGLPRTFPADVTPHRAVVIVTFSQEASEEGAKWTRKLREKQQELGVSIYQVAILEDVPPMVRFVVVSAMRRGIPKELHDNFWIATSTTKEWQEVTGSRSLGHAHVFLLEDRSQITWHFDGAISKPSFQGLLAALSAAKD